MHPYYDTMKTIYLNKLTNQKCRELCSNVISVLAMTMGKGRECLKYRITGPVLNIGEWDDEYVRHFSGELAADEMSLPLKALDMQKNLLDLSMTLYPTTWLTMLKQNFALTICQ